MPHVCGGVAAHLHHVLGVGVLGLMPTQVLDQRCAVCDVTFGDRTAAESLAFVLVLCLALPCFAVLGWGLQQGFIQTLLNRSVGAGLNCITLINLVWNELASGQAPMSTPRSKFEFK
jgi:hypothetical protein